MKKETKKILTIIYYYLYLHFYLLHLLRQT